MVTHQRLYEHAMVCDGNRRLITSSKGEHMPRGRNEEQIAKMNKKASKTIFLFAWAGKYARIAGLQ
jgi:hypothetical protein